MLRYFANRLALFGAGVLLIVTTSFAVVYLLPGDPARMILGPRASSETVAQFRQQAGLDKGIASQYAKFVGRLAHLDLGDSLIYRRPVIDVLGERLDRTAALIGTAVAIMLFCAIAVPLLLRTIGLSLADEAVRCVWTGLAAAPPYVLALLTLTLFAGRLGVLPGVFEPDRWSCWFAAGLVLAVYPTALVSRLFASGLNAEMASDYALRAHAHGFSDASTLIREALVNALNAPLSAIANGLAYFFTGTFFVEVAFGIGGLGSLTYEAVRNKDVTVIAGVCLLFAVSISGLSLVLDIAHHAFVPRLRRSHGW
jgi:peptide/nickel transport system permease protein